MVIKDLSEWLENNGWKKGKISEYDSYNYVWYKQYKKVKPNCYCNKQNPGIQISLKAWDYKKFGYDINFQIELVAEKDDGFWVDLVIYSIGEEIKEVLEKQIQTLIRSWKAIQTKKEG